MSLQPSATTPLRAPRTLLVLLTALAFANAIPNGFAGIDHWQVESGGLIARSWPELWRSLREPLGSMPGWEGAAPYVRPAVILILSLDHWLGGVRPVAYHLTLVLLHLANVLLVYDLLCQLAIDHAAALVTAAVFGVHPLQTAAVSWISGIADPLFTFFVLIAFRLQLAAAHSRPRMWLRLAAALSFMCGLAAKETAIVFPLVVVAAYSLFPVAPVKRSRAMLVGVAPLLVACAADASYRAVVLRSAALGADFGAIPLSVRLRTAPRLIISYLTLPLRFGSLTVCDDFALSTHWDASTGCAFAAVVVLLVALVYCWRRSPVLAFGLAWMLVGLAPALNIVPILHYRADRFFYFPMIGWSLAVATLVQAGLSALARRQLMSISRLRRVTWVGSFAMVLTLAVLTMRRNAVFADDITLFESTLRVSPWCREAHTALGDAYLRAGHSAEAVAEYERARTAQPGRASYVVLPKVLINLGMAQIECGDYAAAETAFTEAHLLQPELLHPFFGLGIANLALGRTSTAVTWLEQAYDRAPNDPDIALNLAIADERLGRTSEAVTLYRHYLDIAPQGRQRALATERIRMLQP